MCTGAYPTVRCNLLASKDALWGTRLPGLGLNAMRRCWLIRMSESKDVWLEFTGEGIWSNMVKHILCYVYIYTQVNIYTLCIYIYIVYISILPPFDCFLHEGNARCPTWSCTTEPCSFTWTNSWELWHRDRNSQQFIFFLWMSLWMKCCQEQLGGYALSLHFGFPCRSRGFFHPLRPLQLNSLLSTITPKVPLADIEGTTLKFLSEG